MVTSLLSLDATAELVGLARTAPLGDFLEIGVYRGGSAWLLWQIAEEQGRRLVLVDTFAGHGPPDPERDNVWSHPEGRFSDGITPEELQAMLPTAVIVQGRFPDVEIPGGPFAFVHVDVDHYRPTKAACELLPARMVKGGVLRFDDYGHSDCPGATAAVDEVFGPPEPPKRRTVRLP